MLRQALSVLLSFRRQWNNRSNNTAEPSSSSVWCAEMAVNRTKEFVESDRYLYDRLLIPKGFSQIDSAMDASYYGNWADPARLVLFSYIEGDCLTTQCDTADEFKAEIIKVCDWLRLNSTLYGIDPGLKATAKKPWEDLGLSDLLH